VPDPDYSGVSMNELIRRGWSRDLVKELTVVMRPTPVQQKAFDLLASECSQ
jgi:hypothetical protein